MQKQLNIGNGTELLNAEFIKRNSFVGNVDDRSLVPKLEELAADNLITIKVKSTKGGFADGLLAGWLSNTIGNVVVCSRIVIYPMVVNGNKAPKNTLINNVKLRKSTSHMMLAVFQKHLYCLKLLYGDDRFVVVRVKILVSVLVILFVFMLVEVCGKGLPG